MHGAVPRRARPVPAETCVGKGQQHLQHGGRWVLLPRRGAAGQSTVEPLGQGVITRQQFQSIAGGAFVDRRADRAPLAHDGRPADADTPSLSRLKPGNTVLSYSH